jgi:2-polyprenyl-6-hydroxyphenyl methylase/3-demethylubiquinone-9 3-methyltransferase
MTQPSYPSTINADEVAKFSAMADAWWDVKGKFKPLHDITPLRIGYIRDHATAHFFCGSGESRIRNQESRKEKIHDSRFPIPDSLLQGLTVLDVGCGGGLASEPLARLGASVTGIDASQKNISIARAHAEPHGLNITYRCAPAETLASEGATFDMVLALEIIEHVADVPAFLHALAALTRSGGMLVITTMNRTLKSLLQAKIGAEYVLRWLPIGTHDWNAFLLPSEISVPLQALGFTQTDLSGMVYRPLSRTWSLSTTDISVNYLLCFTKTATV